MAVALKNEIRNERACLSETELDGVVAGSAVSDYAKTMQSLSNYMSMLSACMRAMSDTQNTLIGNLR